MTNVDDWLADEKDELVCLEHHHRRPCPACEADRDDRDFDTARERKHHG